MNENVDFEDISQEKNAIAGWWVIPLAPVDFLIIPQPAPGSHWSVMWPLTGIKPLGIRGYLDSSCDKGNWDSNPYPIWTPSDP